MATIFKVTWQGNIVGSFVHGPFDMWYCDGAFTPGPGEVAETFRQQVAALNVSTVFDDRSKGIKVTLSPENDPSKETNYLVLGFAEDALCLRLLD